MKTIKEEKREDDAKRILGEEEEEEDPLPPPSVMEKWRNRMDEIRDDLSQDERVETYHFIMPQDEDEKKQHRALKDHHRQLKEKENSKLYQSYLDKLRSSSVDDSIEVEPELRMQPVNYEKIYPQREKDDNAIKVGVFFDVLRKYTRHADGSTIIKKFVNPYMKHEKLKSLSPEQRSIKDLAVAGSYQETGKVKDYFNSERNEKLPAIKNQKNRYNETQLTTVQKYFKHNPHSTIQNFNMKNLDDTSTNQLVPNYFIGQLNRQSDFDLNHSYSDQQSNFDSIRAFDRTSNSFLKSPTLKSINVSITSKGKTGQPFRIANQSQPIPEGNSSDRSFSLNKFSNLMKTATLMKIEEQNQSMMREMPKMYEKDYTRVALIKQQQEENNRLQAFLKKENQMISQQQILDQSSLILPQGN